MPEWLLEPGVGETRAALVKDGRIVEAAVERDDGALRIGLVADAVVGAPLGTGDRTRVTVAGVPALLRGAAGVPEGARLRVRVVREAMPERGNPKPPVVVAAAPDEEPAPAPTLGERVRAAGLPVTTLAPHGPDRLEAAGWGEVMEAARTGLLAFSGGLLRIERTAAMTVIDVDGGLPPARLAVAGAAAAAAAIRLLGIGGSVGVDLPSAGDRAARTEAAAAFDRILPQPFERTAVNGFGFVQIVRPRPRPSLLDLVQSDPPLAAALALVRAADRDPRPGGVALVAAPSVIRAVSNRPEWTAALERRRGAPVGLREAAGLAISAGHVEPLAPR